MSLIRRGRARLYDFAIVSMTAGWYQVVLQHVAHGSHLLDVGIGTGSALMANSERLRAAELRVTGIDVDAGYVEKCRLAVVAAGLSDRVDVKLESIDQHEGGPYDAVYFSGSFMLLPDPIGALHRAVHLLASQGSIYFTQTFEHMRSRSLEIVKPLLRWVTTIDFGRVTYEDEFEAALSAANVEVVERHVLHAGRRRSSVMVVGRPRREF